MKNITITFIFIFIVSNLFSQGTTWEKVYNLLETNCASCHISGHESGLVLEGDISDVYDNLYNVTAYNTTAADKNYKVVMPGDPYKSFLFSKINNDLAIDVHLSAGEGAPCPQGADPLNNKEIELMRQWIIYGAKEFGDNVDDSLITEFYDNAGIQSVPSPPAAPAEADGFQIHYGPFFLWPEDENEYWSKFSTDIATDLEVKKLDVVMGDYSHHYIIYKYDADAITYFLNPFGLRESDPEFMGVSLVTANQYTATIELPEKTAFKWPAETKLDLNSHYINYSADKVLACEVYVNVYTQAAGTAIHEMYSELPANTDIFIPNDNAPHTFDQTERDPGNEENIFLWGITSHTHKYGDDYDVYLRTHDGDRGEKIFDASCGISNGVPGCDDEIYDYQHPPIRYWDTFLPIVAEDGIIHEATFINDGPVDVSFGLTSDDEMMVLIYFFIDDTTGLNLPAGIHDAPEINKSISVYPNPAQDAFYISIQDITVFKEDRVQVEMIDINGKSRYSENAVQSDNIIYMRRNNVPSGIYLLRISDTMGNIATQKIIFD
ncbi:MAG: T9SS type A sorting domain-containing protein [Fimbriimonadaceae bacterium]|nr:T9SS type A sorting domain-containing protein [Chitinophagales bacterium]